MSVAESAPLDERIASPERAGALVLNTLVESISQFVGIPVDELHVAAVLESRGVTDAVARDRYGHEGVFALASFLLPMLSRRAGAAPVARRVILPAWRPLVHGPLYLAPSLVIPAVLAAGDRDRLVVAMVTATVIGWVWGMATGAVGYQYLGREREATAARAMQRMSLAGVLLALACGCVLTLLHAGGLTVMAVMVMQAAYQLAAGMLVFYRHELLLALTVLPGVAAGVDYLGSGAERMLVPLVVGAAGVSVLATVGAAAVVSVRATKTRDRVTAAVRLRIVAAIGTSVTYALLCAVLLLYTNLRFFHAGPDLALAATPLILGMGVVEWRAERFVESGVDLLEATVEVAPFRRDISLRLARELATVLAALAVIALVLMAGLAVTNALTVRGALLISAHVLLGGGFFLGFVLSRHAHYPWFVAGMALVVLAYVALAASRAQSTDAVVLFLEATSALVLLFLAAFAVSNRHIPLFTW